MVLYHDLYLPNKLRRKTTMSSAKKIGLFACTGVVAGNMMGSGIALLPANLASIGGIAIWGWVISIIGAMSLAYVYARLATKNPQQGGPIAAGNISGIRFPDRCALLSCKLDW
jgi:cadaverine:lysine antiporter